MCPQVQYVRFQDVKEAVSLRDVLAHYGVATALREKPNGGLRGPCPFRDVASRSRPFHITPSGKGWHCFCCDEGGDVLQFVVKMEQVSLPEAGARLARWFGLSADAAPPPADQRGSEASDPAGLPPLNQPLTFSLKRLEIEHPFFDDRGFAPETVRYFEAGFCRRGLMKDRIAIPIHNLAGELVAYAGLSPTNGSLKYPDNFNPDLELYNAHRVDLDPDDDATPLVVVRGFLEVWRLHQGGFTNAVALLASNQEPRLAIW